MEIVFIYIDLRYLCTKDNKVIISPYLNSQTLKKLKVV